MNTSGLPAVATAFYSDPYAGRVAAYLKPYKTTHRSWPTIAYRWQTDRGGNCGLVSSTSARNEVAYATRSPLFTDVAVLIEAREVFQP